MSIVVIKDVIDGYRADIDQMTERIWILNICSDQELSIVQSNVVDVDDQASVTPQLNLCLTVQGWILTLLARD